MYLHFHLSKSKGMVRNGPAFFMRISQYSFFIMRCRWRLKGLIHDPHPPIMPHQGTQRDGRLGLNFALDILSGLKI
jgi:hypothetical protein